KIRLSSANSINISRLVPQAFYYFEAYKQMELEGDPVVFCVPSGNFGNLTAGLLAEQMGLPVHHFIAATNANDVVPEYLRKGLYRPRPSIRTISNAMDVGNPSNFARMLDVFSHPESTSDTAWAAMRNAISGFAFSDEETERAVREVSEHYNYVMDPHGAVGYLALNAFQRVNPSTRGVILETAHPSKFKEDMERILGRGIAVPERLASLAHRNKVATSMSTNFGDFKEWLEDNLA
ncbi:MAG: pyridoxal-phosphate dependent enzyme, partial [Lewinella sp.]|nr:pyridoxal-phosphate dependent enzyme [Lewinella sp.]